MNLGRLQRLLVGAALMAMVMPLSPAAALDGPRSPQLDPPLGRLGSPEVFGYLTNWDLTAQIDYSAMTTIAYFGLGATSDGHIKDGSTEYSRWCGSRMDQVIAQAHANGVKVVLTVEKMAWGDGAMASSRALLNDPTARATLVSEIVNEVSNRCNEGVSVDGVTLDFEPIPSDRYIEFAAFLHELRAGLDAVNPGYQLTFASVGSQHPAMYAEVTAAGDADAVIIMGYPLRDIGHNIAGGLAPYTATDSYDLKQVVSAYLNTNIAPENIILALPWYGRDWPTETDAENARVQQNTALYDRARNIGYGNSIALAIANGRRYDATEQTPWAAYRTRYCLDCPETWSEAYYEDVDSLAFKYDWAVNTKGLAGIGIFALGYDNDRPEMNSLLRLMFGGLVDSTPPTGSFAIAANENFCTAPQVRLGLSLADDAGGSGPVFVRLSNQAGTDGNGLLSSAMTYPANAEIPWQLDNPTTGGSTATGSRTVYAQWRDVAGNWSPVASTTFSVPNLVALATITVANGADLVSTSTIPVKVVLSGGGRTLAKLRLSSSSALGSDGLLRDGQNYDPNRKGNFNATFSLIDPALGGADVDGRRSVYVQWRDSAGCWSAPVFRRVTLDRGGPVGSLSLVGAPILSATGDVQVMAPATDAGSGVVELNLSNDGTNWTSFAPTSNPVDWNAGATPDGTWTISARWRDGAGNWSNVATKSLTLDRHGPAGTLLLDGGAATTAASTVTVTASATDISGVAEVLISNAPDTVDGVLSGATSMTVDGSLNWPLAGADTEAGVPEGTATVYAQWRDGLGHWSDVAAATIVVDRSAPIVSVPLPGLTRGSQLNANVPVTATWTSTDLSGVAGEKVQLAREGEPWVVGSAMDGSSPQAGAVDVTSAWQFMVSATDALGNRSEPVQSDLFRARVVEDNSASITYSGRWRVASSTSASGGTTRYATARGATATLSFTGRAVAWVAPIGLKKGKAKVYVDGVLATTVDLRGSGRQRVLVFARNWTTSGQHTIRIKVLGTVNRPRADLDAMVVLY